MIYQYWTRLIFYFIFFQLLDQFVYQYLRQLALYLKVLLQVLTLLHAHSLASVVYLLQDEPLTLAPMDLQKTIVDARLQAVSVVSDWFITDLLI